LRRLPLLQEFDGDLETALVLYGQEKPLMCETAHECHPQRLVC
jgi:hypothetical protein